MEDDECNYNSDSQYDETDLLDPNYDFQGNVSDTNDEELSDDEGEANMETNNFESFKIISNKETYNNYLTTNRKTSPILSQFEITRVLGLRAQQIELGNDPLISVPETVHDSKSIAELEFEQGLIPFIIRRYLPDGSFEDWKLADFSNI